MSGQALGSNVVLWAAALLAGMGRASRSKSGGSSGGTSGSTAAGGSGGSTTGAGTRGTSGGAGPLGALGLGADTKAFINAAVAARAGQPVDLDGDGTPETTFIADADGGLTVSIDADQDGNPELFYTRDAQLNGQYQLDADSDGTPEETATFTAGSTFKGVYLRDTNLDGTVDQRETQTWDPGSGTFDELLEDDTQQTGTFTTTGELSGPLVASANPRPRSSCDAFQSFPSGNKDAYGPVSVSDNGSASSGADGSCSKDEASKLGRAVDCAVRRARDCLGKTNTSFYAKLVIHLEAGGSYSLGCGNRCGAVATTRSDAPWWSRGASNGQTNFDPGWLDNASDEDACDSVFHEMIHWSDDAALHLFHDFGDDKIYSCARYCSGCNHSLMGSHNVNRRGSADCAVCADSLSRKRACGIEPKYEDVQADYGFCRGGLGCILGTCTSYKGLQSHLCSGEKDGDPSDVCCGGCPSSCTGSEDQPCGAAPMLPRDTCNDAPGACTHN